LEPRKEFYMSKYRLRLEILQKISTLATAAFGLVAALAWNSAIQDLFKKINIFGKPDSLLVKFMYAIMVTIIIVVVTILIGRSTNKLRERLNLNPEDSDSLENTKDKK